MSSIVQINGMSIQVDNNNNVLINGQKVSVDGMKQPINQKKVYTDFNVGHNTLEKTGVSFEVSEDGVLKSVTVAGQGDIEVNGNVNTVKHTGAGDIEVNGNVDTVVHTGAGDVL